MTKLIQPPVPYLSQWDQDARLSIGDCGIVSVAMIARWMNIIISPDELLHRAGLPSGRLTYSFSEVIRAADVVGIKLKYVHPATWETIKTEIDANRPIIPLLDYEFLHNSQDTSFKGNHFWVITGYDSTGIFCNDPDWWGIRRADGHNRHIPTLDFENAIAAVGHQALFLET